MITEVYYFDNHLKYLIKSIWKFYALKIRLGDIQPILTVFI